MIFFLIFSFFLKVAHSFFWNKLYTTVLIKSLSNWSSVSFLVIVLDFVLLLDFSLPLPELSNFVLSFHQFLNSSFSNLIPWVKLCSFLWNFRWRFNSVFKQSFKIIKTYIKIIIVIRHIIQWTVWREWDMYLW